MPNKPDAPMNCEMNWSLQWFAHDRGRRLICKCWTSLYQPQSRWDCTPLAKSDIYDCLVLVGTLNGIACQQLDKLEHECPIITKPTAEVFQVHIYVSCNLLFLSVCIQNMSMNRIRDVKLGLF